MITRKLCLSLFPIFLGCTALIRVEGSSLICEIESSNNQYILKVSPTTDLYSFDKLDLSNHFRFSAQYLYHLNKLKTYTYYDSKDRYVLIHASEHKIATKTCDQDFGKNKIYSTGMERELLFHCKLACQ
jgi:hypothetical protein